MDFSRYIRESNLIEDINDPAEDKQSLEAWEFIKFKPYIGEQDFLTLHNLITINQLPKYESGHYRKISVIVGGRICPKPFLAEQLTYNWLVDMIQHWKTLDPIEMHIRFEKIHPFADGNGRTGRMLMWWHQLKKKQEPTLFLNSEKHEKYYPLFK